MIEPTDLSILKRDVHEIASDLKLLANPEHLLILCQIDEREVLIGD
ncbi:hypothetical protein [Sphingopyxis chilensis]